MEIIRSELLSRYSQIVFGMSTRNGGVSARGLGLNLSFDVGDDKVNVIENRRRFFGALHIGLDELAFPMQCHSTSAMSVSTWGGYEDRDALITREFGVFLVVSVADCVPIFLFDPVTRSVAGIHAGWRGTSGGIVRNVMALLSTEHGVRAEDVVAFVGPAAGMCCYEVSKDVGSLFNQTLVKQESGGSWKVDLKGENVRQLKEAGVPHGNIEQHAGCTIHEAEQYHSYRRDGSRSGRMMGVIGIIR